MDAGIVAMMDRLRTLASDSAAAHSGECSTASGSNTPVPHDDDPCGMLAPPKEPGELGRIGGYRVLSVLGTGGMGVVYRAEDTTLRRIVALKLMRPTLAVSPAARQRFLREARSAAAVRHDHIVTIHQAGEADGIAYLAMELLEGETLEHRLKREPRLPIAEAVRIGREIAEGLAAAHERGLIHRDIKPSNIWLEHGTGRVKLLDFGLARGAEGDTSLTQSGAIIGTPAYMAPEQVDGVADARSDLFSLGCVLYRMVTGRPPFSGATTMQVLQAIATCEPEPAERVNPEAAGELSHLVARLLAKVPQKRCATAREVVHALKHSAKPEVSERVHHTDHRRPYILFACAAAAVLGVGLTGIVLLMPTSNGTIRIEVNDPQIKLAIDGGELKIVGADKLEYTVAAGPHALKIKHGAKEFETERFVLRKGDTVTLKIELLPELLRVRQDGKLVVEKKLAAATDKQGIAAAGWHPVPRGDSPLDKLDPKTIPESERFSWQPKELVAVLGSHRQRLWGQGEMVTISPDGAHVAAWGWGARPSLYSFDSGQLVTNTNVVPVFSPNGSQVFATAQCIYDSTGWIDAQKVGWTESAEDNGLHVRFSTAVEQDNDFHGANFSLDGALFVTAHNKPIRVGLWRIGKIAKRIGEWPGFCSPALSPDGKLLALVKLGEGTVELFAIAGDNVEPRKLPPQQVKTAVHSRQRYTTSADSVAFTPDGHLAVLAADRKSMAFWDVADRVARRISTVTFSHPSDRFLFATKAPVMLTSSYNAKGFDVWRLTETGAVRETQSQGDFFQQLHDLAISADGKRITSTHLTGAVLFWELQNGQLVQRNPIQRQPAIGGGVNDGANYHFSPSGEYLTTPCETGGITLWHLGGKSTKGVATTRPVGAAVCGFYARDAFAERRYEEIGLWRAKSTGAHDAGALLLSSRGMRQIHASPESGRILATFLDQQLRVHGRLFDTRDPNGKSAKDFEVSPLPGWDHYGLGNSRLSTDGRVYATCVALSNTKTYPIRIFDIGNTAVRSALRHFNGCPSASSPHAPLA